MKSALLKGIIVLAFIGMVIVIAAIFVLNSNVEDRAFKDISARIHSFKFSNFFNDGRGVRFNYNGAIDDYSVYVCNEIELLQEGINTNVSILKYTTKMGRSEKDNLIKMNNAYMSQLEDAKSALVGYYNFYNSLTPETPVSIINGNLPSRIATFVRSANLAYSKGSAFYKQLVRIINKTVYKSNSVKNYSQIIYEMANVFADKTVEDIEYRMSVLNGGYNFFNFPLYGAARLKAVDNFNSIRTNREKFNASQELLSGTALNNFIKAFNIIDFAKLVSDAQYINSLSAANQAYAATVRSFLSSTGNFFNLNMSV